MSDNRSASSPPVVTTPTSGTPPVETESGVELDAARKIEGFLAMFALIGAIPGAIRRGWAYATATPGRRYSTAFAFVALIALAVFGLTGGEMVAPQPVTVAVAAPGLIHTVAKDDEHLALIGKPYGVSRQEMIDANMSLIVDYTNTVCPALDRPATYFAGLLKDGKRHRDGTYCQFTMYEGANPTYIGTKLAQDSLRKGDPVIVPCTPKSTPLIKACQSIEVAQNVN